MSSPRNQGYWYSAEITRIYSAQRSKTLKSLNFNPANISSFMVVVAMGMPGTVVHAYDINSFRSDSDDAEAFTVWLYWGS